MRDEFRRADPANPLDALSVRQHGLITRAQALSVLSRAEFEYRVGSGQLVVVRRGVYRCQGAQPTWRQRMMAVCLSVPDPVVASHRSAGRLWELEDVPRADPEITVPRGRSVRLPGVYTHRADLPASDITKRFEIPVTTIARTLLDLSSVVDPVTLARVVDDSLRRRYLIIEDLATRVAACNRGGRRRLLALKAIVEARGRDYVSGDSVWEDRLFNWIVEEGLPTPDRQVWVIINEKSYRIDMGYVALKIAIEFDGYEWHHLRSKFDSDRERITALQLAGWLVLSFTSSSSKEHVIGSIKHARAQRFAGR
jgi:very-short-patch-repair endonuclease